MNTILLITDVLDHSAYTKMHIVSSTALKGLDKNGNMLTQLLPSYIADSRTRQSCCGERYNAVGFNTENLTYNDFVYLVSRVGKESGASVEAPIYITRYTVGIDGNVYERPDDSVEWLTELYEALSGDRNVLGYLEAA